MPRLSPKVRTIQLFRRAGGVLRTSQALKAGVHPRDLYALRDSGALVAVSRGVWRLAELPPVGDPDLFTVAARVSRAVIALVSALHFHGLTAEIPHRVTIALPRGSARPRLDWPPLEVVRLSAPAFGIGIESHRRDGVVLRVTSPARTVTDCFRFRSRVGLPVAVEALRTGLEERRFTPAELLRAARAFRVARIVRPYLEALQ